MTVTDPASNRCPARGGTPGWPAATPGRCSSPTPKPSRSGDPGDYLNRAGFWHGAIGVAACWLGGARRVADPLYRCAATESADAYSLAHLGAVDAALAAGDAILADSATQIDSDPFDRAGTAQLLARRVRAAVEHAVDEAITRTGRALGPGPLTARTDGMPSGSPT